MLSARLTAVAVLAAAAAFFAAPASAQIGKSGGPVDIESDSLQVIDAERKAIFSGNVDAQQGDSRLKSRTLTVYFGPKQAASAASASTGDALGASFGEIDRLIAEGDVLYLTPRERARGDTGVYEMKTDTITLTGGVIVTRGDNVIKGDRMVIEVSTGKTTITSNARSTTGKPPRVRGVFLPSSKPAAAPAAAPSAPATQ